MSAPAAEVVQVEAGWFVGAYRYAQRPSGEGSPLYPADLSMGYDDDPALLRGLGVRARAWPTPRFGLEVQLAGTSYTEDLSGEAGLSLPPPERRAMERASAAALARRALPLGAATLSPEVQLGLWGGSVLLHGQEAGDDGAVSPAVRETWIAGPFAASGARLAFQGFSVGAGAQVGAALDLSPAWVGVDLDLRAGLTHGLFASARIESSSRIAEVRDPDGLVVGTLEDQLSGATLSLGYAR